MESHVVNEESRRGELQVLDLVLLAPLDVLDHLGCVSVETLCFGDKVAFVHPVTVDELGDVVADIVRADNHATLALTDVVLFDVFHGAGHCRAGRTTAQEAFLADHFCRVLEGLLVSNFEPLINQGAVADSRNEVISDTLDLVLASFGLLVVELRRLSKDRAVGVNADDLDV